MRKIQPKRCFCHYTAKELIKYLKLRYIENIPTVELINNAKDNEEKEKIALVGMIDVKEEAFFRLAAKNPKEKAHIIGCRAESMKILEKLRAKNTR